MLKTLFSFLLLTLFISCSKETEVQHIVKYNEEDFKLNQGVLLYKNLPLTGKLTKVDRSSGLNFESEYTKGKKNGEETVKYKNGNLYEKRYYKSGTKIGLHKGWWENGQQKFEYYFNNGGEYNGSVKEWYSNGQLFKFFNYSNGKEIGSQKMWQSNGKIRANYVAKDGERFGLIGLKKCYTVNIKDEKIK